MNWLSELPSDLLSEISVYLRPKDIENIAEIVKISYKSILSVKYPGFHYILKIIKKENPVYKNYPWETALELIDRIDRYLLENNKFDDTYNIKSNDPELIIDILLQTKFETIHDMTAAYSLYTEHKNHEYYKYIKSLPHIKKLNQHLFCIYNEYKFDNETVIKVLDYIEKLMSETINDIFNLGSDYQTKIFFSDIIDKMLYLSLMMNTLKDKELRNKILNVNLESTEEESSNRMVDAKVIHYYIIDNYKI